MLFSAAPIGRCHYGMDGVLSPSVCMGKRTFRPGGASGPFAPGFILRPQISFDDLSQNHSKAPDIFSLAPPRSVLKIPMTAPDFVAWIFRRGHFVTWTFCLLNISYWIMSSVPGIFVPEKFVSLETKINGY